MSTTKKHYCVAYWDADYGLQMYTYHNEEVQYTTIELMKEFLVYVKKQEPEEDWNIYELTPTKVVDTL